MRGILDGRENIFAFKRRIIGEDLLERRAAGDQFQYIGHPNPLTTNTRTPTALPRLDSNPPQPLWIHMFTLLPAVASREWRMIEDMAQVHMTEAEVTKDFAAVLEKVRQGTEVVIEEGYRSVAVISPVKGPGRPIDECIALAKEHGSGTTLDEDFADDLENIIAERKPLDTSAWD